MSSESAVVERLEKLSPHLEKINNSVPRINYGGCGAFAVELYELLERLGYKPSITVLTYRPLITQSAIGNGLENVMGGIDHIIVRVGKYCLDSEGVHSVSETIREWGVSEVWVNDVPIYMLKMWVANRLNWNKVFDRSNIPVIKTYLNQITI